MTKILNKVDELPKTDETETLKENIMRLFQLLRLHLLKHFKQERVHRGI